MLTASIAPVGALFISLIGFLIMITALFRVQLNLTTKVAIVLGWLALVLWAGLTAH